VSSAVPLPPSFLQHLRAEGYHPRSDKHSNALGEAIVDGLVGTCDAIGRKAASGELVYDLNFDLVYGTATWNIDLVLGPPPPEVRDQVRLAGDGIPILRSTPSTIQIGVELKAVMTEHRKAVKNRKRDLEAHHEHVHNYDERAIAAGVLLVNVAERFKSPLRPEVSAHRHAAAKVEHCINEANAISVRGGPTGYGLDAKCVVVVDMDNVNLATTAYRTTPPAPQIGHPLHYDAFIQRLCSEFTRRFGG
jgi:hypothetical protein